MSFEYRAQITVTKMAGNGDVQKKTFNGTCSLGVKTRRPKGAIAKRAEAYLEAVNKSQGPPPKVTNTKTQTMPKFEVVSRVASIPIVGSGIDVTEKVYHRIRESNVLIRWYLTLGEKSLSTGVALALPAVSLFESPLHQLDRFLCKSLDAVGERVPSIYLPPQELYTETRHYVLRRTESVKQLGEAVLDSRITAATAAALDRALSTADKYVDKILPPDQQDANDVTSADAVDGASGDSGRAKAVQAVQHGARFKRKLQRRLTRQALAEAKAIREQIHVLVYVMELVAKDPALAWKKAKELYASLSAPEPENQARPNTMEELFVLLSRETARKVVHLVNYTHSDLPKNIRQGLSIVTGHLATAADALLKSVPVENALSEVRGWPARLQALLQHLQAVSKTYLEHLAIFLAGNEEREKIAPRSTYEPRDELENINGVN
ncbi:hypothetical protein O0L34_g17011 [Tuta absoluta]|nr:hypothetical protein O0L34_g17011 [Tuta absoluta]